MLLDNLGKRCPATGHFGRGDAETRAFKPNTVTDLSGLTISNPPTQAQVTALRDKLDELLAALQV